MKQAVHFQPFQPTISISMRDLCLLESGSKDKRNGIINAHIGSFSFFLSVLDGYIVIRELKSITLWVRDTRWSLNVVN